MASIFDFDLKPADWIGSVETVGSSPATAWQRSPETVTMNAAQSMVPVTADAGSSWSGFWQDTIKAVASYSIAKDAQRNQVSVPQAVYVPGGAGYVQPQPTLAGGNGLLLLIIGGLALFALSGDGRGT